MEMERIRKKIIAVFFVVWVIVFTGAGQTISIEAADGPYASNPIPADGAVIPGEPYPEPPEPPTHVYTTLFFEPGVTAVKHTGYFSEDYSKVAGRDQDANLGPPPYPHWPQYETTFWVGFPLVPPANDTLVRGKWYYWAVDETDDLGNIYSGDIWNFFIRTYKASLPNPPDEAVIVETDVLLSWSEGFEVEEHDVYFGTNFDDVNNASSGPFDPDPPLEYLGTVTEPSFMITGLSENTTYYWRVDEVSGRLPPPLPGGTIYKGDVWAFTIIRRYKASSPNPPNEAVTVETDVLLSWSEGFEVEEHDVYMGTSWEDVNNAVYDPNNPSPEYFGTVTDPCFMVTGLSENTTYYWRVDEVFGRFMPGTGTIYKGDVWEFTVMSYYATKPDPPNEAMYVNTDVLLSWEPGYDGSMSMFEHDIYMGTSPELLEFIDTKMEPNYQCSGLKFGTKYYWRVDEVWDRLGPGFPGTVYEGGVWCFTTLDSTVVIQALVEIEPDILNLASQGNWITSYIRMPEEYSVADIDPNSILLEGEIEPQEFWLTGDQQIAIIKFDRSDVQAILEVGYIELTVTGQLTDGTLFEAKDTIEVVDIQ